jgi:hypothetical protein
MPQELNFYYFEKQKKWFLGVGSPAPVFRGFLFGLKLALTISLLSEFI